MNHAQPTGPSTVLAQPAIFTVYAWHPLEDGTRLLKTHLVAAHSSELAENLFRQINTALLEGAECFISTDFLLDHLNSFGACHAFSNTISRSEPLSEQHFQRWAKNLTADQWEDGELQPATIRPIVQNKAGEAVPNSPKDVFLLVEDWHCNGLPAAGLTSSERNAIIESALGSYLAEHTASTEQELQALDDKALVAAHYSAMADAAR